MRLLDTKTGQFVNADPQRTRYAILSHTWDKEGEQTYEQLKKTQQRYAPEAQPLQPPRGPENITSSSPEQIRDAPSLPLPASQLPHDESPSVIAPLENVVLPSPEQGRDDPSSPPPPSQLPSSCPSSVTTPLTPPSGPSKSWFSQRMGQLKRRLYRHRSARNAHQMLSDGDKASITPPANAPPSNDPSTPPVKDPHDTASSDPSAPSPGDSPPQTTRTPTARKRLTQSEVDALLRFMEVYGLADPTQAPSIPASSDHSTPAAELPAANTPQSIWDDPDLSPKIRDACKITRENGYDYIWIDSCCIDKSSSSELSEAINSMYKWYHLADVCYAYLADVPQPGEDPRAEGSCFRKSRWFTRGWTLQELIAPGRVEFLAQDWTPIRSKHALCDLVESITKIHYDALLKLKPLEEFSVAQRLSWAANRETTREEDRAYSLLGIFDINMPTLYGEGDRAFRRLQEQIMQRIPDQSLFAWGTIHLPGSQPPKERVSHLEWLLQGSPSPSVRNQSLFAHWFPHGFENSDNIRCVQLPPSLRYEIAYTPTPFGIRTKFQMIALTHDFLSSMLLTYANINLHLSDDAQSYLAILGCEHIQHPGHLLGRVCSTRSSESNVNFLYAGTVGFGRQYDATNMPDLFPLSPETIWRWSPHIELKTVYISHPQSNYTDEDSFWSLQIQPYTAIKLVLLTESRDALRSRGYSADLRDPDPDHRTTHRLTLSKDAHTITVQFRHTLEHGGKMFTMDAEVELLEPGAQLDSAPPDSHQADRRTVSCGDEFIPWSRSKDFQTVRVGSAGVGALTVDLSLRFLTREFYGVIVDVRGDDAPPAPPDMRVIESAPPAPSAVESATERAALREIGDGSPSGVRVVDAADEAGREEAGGCGTASAEARPGDRRDPASGGGGSEEVGSASGST